MHRYKFLIACLPLLLGTAAHASNAGPGRIHNVHAMPNGVILFYLEGPRDAPPTCGSGQPTRWALDGSTPAGQARLSLLLTAYSSQKQVSVRGTSTCPDWLDTETVSYFMTGD